MKLLSIIAIAFISLNLVAEETDGFNVPNENDAMYIYNTPTKRRIGKRQISFLVWNIHKEVEESQWKEDFKKLVDKKDIVLVEEFTTNIKRDAFPSGFTPYAGVFGEAFEHKGRRAGNINLSTYESIESRVYHSQDREPIIKTPKAIVKTVYELRDLRSLMVINVHGINIKGLKPFKRYMDIVLRQVLVHQGPIVVAGDFNTWSKRRIAYMKNNFNFYGLTQIEFFNDQRIKRWKGNKLDHAFQRGFDVVFGNIPDVKSSDHAPMEFILQLKQ